MPVIPKNRWSRWEDHKFEASLGYIANYRLAIATYGDPISKTKQNNTRKLCFCFLQVSYNKFSKFHFANITVLGTKTISR
jgi:hypothetical protein